MVELSDFSKTVQVRFTDGDSSTSIHLEIDNQLKLKFKVSIV
jgi:hypothetical protein